MFCLNVFWAATVVGLLSGLEKKSLLWQGSPCFLCQKHNTSLYARSLLQRKQNQQTPDFAIPRRRPLWLSLTMTSMFHQMASRSIIVHHLDIVGMPNRFCHSVNHRLLGENTRARSMFSMLCAVECQVSKFCWSSATEDLFVQWSCKIGFWCWQLVALTDSRFMAGDGSRPDFYCLSPCYLRLPNHLKKTPKIGEGRNHTHGSRWDIDHDDGSPREGGSSWSQWGSRLRAPKPKHPTGRTRPSDVHICNPKDGYCGKIQGGGRLINLFETLPILQLGLSTVRRVVRANKDNPTLQHSSQRGRERNDRNLFKSAWTLISFLLLFPFFAILSSKWNG